MTHLGDVLAGRAPGGLYRCGVRLDPESVRAVVEPTRWRLARLDGERARSKAEVLADLGRVLGFPAYYGANLDALAECLGDLCEDTVLLWEQWSHLAYDDPDAFTLVCRVLTDRSEPRDPASPALVVLLSGEGHHLDVPLLD